MNDHAAKLSQMTRPEFCGRGCDSASALVHTYPSQTLGGTGADNVRGLHPTSHFVKDSKGLRMTPVMSSTGFSSARSPWPITCASLKRVRSAKTSPPKSDTPPVLTVRGLPRTDHLSLGHLFAVATVAMDCWRVHSPLREAGLNSQFDLVTRQRCHCHPAKLSTRPWLAAHGLTRCQNWTGNHGCHRDYVLRCGIRPPQAT